VHVVAMKLVEGEMPELRAPENSRTGIEIKPNVRYPDQTEAAIVFVPSVFADSHQKREPEHPRQSAPGTYFKANTPV
jgi:hypothetical protein